MEVKLKSLISKEVIGGNFEVLNKFLEGTKYKVKNDNQIYDEHGIARASFSLSFVEDNIVRIKQVVPYGVHDELARVSI